MYALRGHNRRHLCFHTLLFQHEFNAFVEGENCLNLCTDFGSWIQFEMGVMLKNYIMCDIERKSSNKIIIKWNMKMMY